MYKIWIKILKFNFYDLKKNQRILNLKNFRTSPWIIDIIKKNKFNLEKYKLPINLIKIKVSDLGFKNPVELKLIYKKAQEKGLKLVPPEIAIYSRILYKKRKTGEWIRFATPLHSMIDSDGVPHLPKLGYALKKIFFRDLLVISKSNISPKK